MKACPQCNLRYPDDSTYCFVDGTTLVVIADPRIGTTIAGRYVLEDVLGEGGMATVYKARHKLVDRPCAVKIMSPTLARDKVVRERFRREAKAAQKLAHPNIIEIFDHGDTEDGTSYLVMELLSGCSLADLIEKGPLALDRALPLMVQIARALARAHDFEVIHRDLKPENIFVADGDVIKLLDFGIARSMQDSRLTGVGEVFGTPQYMAPERITSIDAGPAADLYAVGIIFYEMLTAKLPFDAPDIPTFFVKHMKEPPPKLRVAAPNAPPELEDLVERLLQKDPKQRPVDAHRVVNDLVAICRKLGIAVPPEPATVTLPSSREPPKTLPPVAIDRWAHRTVVFEQMLARAYGQASPPDLVHMLGEVKRLVRAITDLRTEAVAEQRTLEEIETKEREGRQRFGAAMDALGHDMSAARDESRGASERVAPLGEDTEKRKAAFVAAQKEILAWEGRSGFAEPYAQLAAAYRTAADRVDEWLAARKAEKSARAQLDEKERTVADLEYQIHELRSALQRFEQGIEQEKSSQEKRIGDLGKRADAMEAELVGLATRFCAPLRGRPELSPFFKELEDAVAA